MSSVGAGASPAKQLYFFECSAAVQRLCAEAADWLGKTETYRAPTPFRKMSIAKGPTGGVDCAGLVQSLLIAAGVGAGRPWKFPRDPADYQGHVAAPKILSYLRGQVEADPQSKLLAEIFAEIPLPQFEGNPPDELFMPGDLWILQRMGLVHMPVILRGRKFVNVIPRRWVEEGTIQNSAFSEHFVALFRARAL